MTDLQRVLQETIIEWRKVAEEADLAGVEVANRFAQGHLHGMSIALDNAARHIEMLLKKDIA